MGEANRKKIAEYNDKIRAKERKVARKIAIKRLPKALFWATTYPIWVWLVFFLSVMKDGKSPFQAAMGDDK